MALLTTLVLAESTLQGGFRNPPQEARPQTWWHWMNGNVSREGIVADLDAMAAIGLGGVTIFDAGCDVPEGPLCFGTEEWFDTVRFAAHEAHRRGLEVILSNCSGWSSSGDYWPLSPHITDQASWCAVEFFRPDLAEGVVLVFRRRESPFDRACYRLQGLESAAAYELVDADSGTTWTVGGAELSVKGLLVQIPEQAMSKLFFVRKRS